MLSPTFRGSEEKPPGSAVTSEMFTLLQTHVIEDETYRLEDKDLIRLEFISAVRF